MGQNQPKFFLFHLHKLSGCLANLALTTTSAIFIVNSQQAHQITLFTMGHSVCTILFYFLFYSITQIGISHTNVINNVYLEMQGRLDRIGRHSISPRTII